METYNDNSELQNFMDSMLNSDEEWAVEICNRNVVRELFPMTFNMLNIMLWISMYAAEEEGNDAEFFAHVTELDYVLVNMVDRMTSGDCTEDEAFSLLKNWFASINMM